MKNKDILIAILITLLIILGIVTWNIYQENQEFRSSFNFIGNEQNFKLESIDQFQKEYEEALLELEAEDFLDKYGTIEMEEAISIDEFKAELNNLEEVIALDDVKKCRIMKRWLRKQKCKPKRKIYKAVISKTKIGSIGYESGKIAINAPQISRFKLQLARINVLMETFYNLRASVCDSQGYCYTNAMLLACILPNDQEIKRAYLKCAALYTGETQLRFVEVLKLLFKNIEKFQDEKISEEAAKAVVNAELDKITQELTNAEQEQDQDENSTDDESGEDKKNDNN